MIYSSGTYPQFFSHLRDFYNMILAKVETKIGLSLRHTLEFLNNKEAGRINLVTLKHSVNTLPDL